MQALVNTIPQVAATFAWAAIVPLLQDLDLERCGRLNRVRT
jgi:hypothetical protein